MNQYTDILINSARDAYYALSHLDEPEALRILNECSALYADATEEHIQRDAADLFSVTPAPSSREELRLQFRLAVENALKRRWVDTLTQQEADMLEDILRRAPGMGSHITIAYGVDIQPGEIRVYRKLNKEDEAYRLQCLKEAEYMHKEDHHD